MFLEELTVVFHRHVVLSQIAMWEVWVSPSWLQTSRQPLSFSYSPMQCLCLVASNSCSSPPKAAFSLRPSMQPLVMLLIEHDILNSHLYCDQAKCFDFGEKGSMAESWRKTKWELQPFFFLFKNLFIKVVFRRWLTTVLYGMQQIPGRQFKLTQLLAYSFAFEDYSESALVSSSLKAHTGCDTTTRSRTEKQ